MSSVAIPINIPGHILIKQTEVYAIDIQVVLVENWVLAAICSAFGSGFLVLLYVKCMSLLWTKQSQRSPRMRYFLAAYMTLMMSLSLVQTVMIAVLSIGSIRRLAAEAGSQHFLPEKAKCSFCNAVEIVGQICAAIVNWCMDGFMIWRCMVLYRDLPRFRRLALCVFGFIISLASAASGILFIVPWFPPTLKFHDIPGPWRHVSGPLSLFACVTLFINITFTILISIRLWRHQSRLQNLFGPGHGSIYRRIVVILLESAALVVVANILMIVLLLVPVPGATPVSCSVIHIYVGSPLIILYRIHKKKDATTEISDFNVTRQLEMNETKRSQLEPLQFLTPHSETATSRMAYHETPEHVSTGATTSPESSSWMRVVISLERTEFESKASAA